MSMQPLSITAQNYYSELFKSEIQRILQGRFSEPTPHQRIAVGYETCQEESPDPYDYTITWDVTLQPKHLGIIPTQAYLEDDFTLKVMRDYGPLMGDSLLFCYLEKLTTEVSCRVAFHVTVSPTGIPCLPSGVKYDSKHKYLNPSTYCHDVFPTTITITMKARSGPRWEIQKRD